MTLLSLCIPGRPALRPRRDLALQALVLAALATPLMLQAAVLKLRLLETTDLHMNLLNYDYYQDKLTDDYGLAKSITLIKAARYDADGKRVATDARRIVNLQYQGKPIDDAARFIVVTNNYRASGGGGFPGLDGKNIVMDAPDENRDALVQYMRATETLDPAGDDNWRILPVPGVKLRFQSGAAAVAHLARYPKIKLVKDNGDGSALFELVP